MSRLGQHGRLTGGPARAQRSGSRGERRGSEVNELCRLRRSEGYGACDDEAQANQVPQGVLQLMQ